MGDRGLRFALLGTSLFLLLTSRAEAQDVPLPDADAIKEAEKGIRDVYKKEFARRKAEDRKALAAQLHKLASDEQKDRAAQYVLYSNARELYSLAGDWKSAWKIVDEMGAVFALDPLPPKEEALKAAKKTVRRPEDVGALASAYLTLLRDATDRDAFSIASGAAKEAAGLARKLRDASLAALVRSRKARLDALVKKHQRLKSPLRTLETQPDDPKANEAVGRYRVFEKGDWKAGLPMLAKGSDAALADLAARDLAAPDSPADRAKVGDGWYGLAEKEKGRVRDHLIDRTLHWYGRALPGLSGLTQKLVAKRIDVLNSEVLMRGTWVDVSSLDLYEVSGAKPKTFTLGDGLVNAKLKELPIGEFDALLVRIRYPQEKKSLLRIEYELDVRALMVDHMINKLVRGHRTPADGWSWLLTTPLPDIPEFSVMVVLSEGNYVIYLDGKEVKRIATGERKFKRFEFGSASTPVVLEEIRLRKIE